MKWIISAIAGYIGLLVGLMLFHSLKDVGDFLAFAVALSFAVFAFKYYGDYRAGASRAIGDAVSTVRRTSDKITSQVERDDSEFYATAEEEVESKTYDPGLWSQALVKANGDESKRKITYMKLRVAQLRKATLRG